MGRTEAKTSTLFLFFLDWIGVVDSKAVVKAAREASHVLVEAKEEETRLRLSLYALDVHRNGK